MPFYEGEVITFDVVPTKLKFKVNYKSVVLKVTVSIHPVILDINSFVNVNVNKM